MIFTDTTILILCFHMQAIALSLQNFAEVSSVVHDKPSNKINSNIDERKGKTQIQEDTGRKNKRKKSVCYLWQICIPCFLVFL